jgi:predicted permease
VVFGLAPALFTRVNVAATLASGGRSASASPRERRARHALVVAQIMTAFVLVFGAGLFLNSFVRLTQVPLGFDPANRFTLGVTLTGSAYATPPSVLAFSRDLLERIEAMPGVARAAVTTSVPLGSGPLALFGKAGAPAPAPGEEQRSIARAVGPGYFDTVGIRRLAGRDFTDRDVAGSTPVVIINEAIARRVFEDSNPIGQSIALLPGSRTPWLGPATFEIVGVVGSVKDVGINEVEFFNLYLPFAQRAVSPLQIVVQSAVPVDQLIDRARRTVLEVDPNLPLPGVMTMAARVEQAFRGDRFHLLLIAAFALTALVLAAISIYAAMAYATEQRTPEFGLRLALGARPSGILGLALKQAVTLGVLGTALGLAAAIAIARVIGDALYLVPRSHQGLIYGVTTTDPLTLAVACAVLLTVAVAAGLLPARRAAAVDPATALR